MQAKQKNLDEKLELIDRQDSITEKLSTASAIIDCIRMLTAMERMPKSGGGRENGEGYANGHRLRDESAPLALFHAMELVDGAKEASEALFRDLQRTEQTNSAEH